MALETVAEALLRYRIDTSDMEAGLGRLSAKQKELLAQEQEAAEIRNQKLDQYVGALAKVGLALDAVSKAVAFGKEAFEKYADAVRLEAAAAGADMEKLKEASHGLRTEEELRAFAAKAMHGAGKLNNEQMADSLEAMRALTKQGFDSVEVYDAVTNAVVGLKTKGLEKLGITIGETHSRAEKFDQIMYAIHQKADEGRGMVDGEATSIKQFGVSMEDSMNRLKESIGKLVVSLGPLLLVVTKIVDKVAWLVDKFGDGWGDLVKMTRSSLGDEDADKALANKYGMGRTQAGDWYDKDAYKTAKAAGFGGTEAQFYVSRMASSYGIAKIDALKQIGAEGFEQITDWIKAKGKEAIQTVDDYGKGIYQVGEERRRKAAEEAQAEAKRIAEAWEKLAKESLKGELEYRKKLADEYGLTAGRDYFGTAPDEVTAQVLSVQKHDAFWKKFGGDKSLGQAAEGGGFGDDLQKQLLANPAYKDILQQGGALEHQTFLEQIFGKVEDFKMYEKAFDTLAKAAGESLAAIIDGANSTGFQKQVANGLHALEVEALTNALKWGATAAGFAVFGDVPQATAALETAGLWAAAGVAAGLGARELGYGSSSSGGSPSAGRGAGAYGGGGGAPVNGGSGTTKIIVYGDPGADNSPRMAQQKAKRIVAQALGSQGGLNS